jgi:hypothetical protein
MKITSVVKRRLSLESLEDRRVMAGFVQADIQNGDLVIKGDWRLNKIVVYQGALENQVVVSGVSTNSPGPNSVDNPEFQPTRVNGKLLPVVLNGFTGSVKANMGAGSDTFLMTNLNVPGDVVLNTEQGKDSVQIFKTFTSGRLQTGPEISKGAVNIQGSVVVQTGDGDDNLFVESVNVAKDVTLHGGDGSDSIGVTGTPHADANAVKPRIGGNLLIHPGAAADRTFAGNIHVAGNFEIHDTAGSQSNVLGRLGSAMQIEDVSVKKDLNIFSTAFNDGLRVRAFAKNINIHTGNGSDGVELASSASNEIHVELGNGDDYLSILASKAASYTVLAGNGNDTVKLALRVTADSFFADLGEGQDKFEVARTTVNKSAKIYGGAGGDRYIDNGDNIIANLLLDSISKS